MKRKNSGETVHQSKELLRLAAWAGKMYAYEWDLATNVVVRSPECLSILGSTEPLRLSRDQLFERVHPDDRQKFVAAVSKLGPENPTCRISYRMSLPGGGLVWLEKSGRAFFDRHGRMLRMIGMVADVTERKLAEEALSGVSRRLIEAQEQERTRIARDLHDDVAQRLAMVSIELEQLRRVAPDWPAELRTRIVRLHKEMVEISSNVQEMSHELHSSKLAYLGPVAAMRSLCEEFAERHNVEIDFESHDLPNELSSETALCLFRVLQEALHNAAKHSGARHFDVQLWRTTDQMIHLVVKDSGIGFEPDAAREGRGLGLTSMQERLRLVQGDLRVESQPNRGTTVHARVPFSSGSGPERAADTLNRDNRDTLTTGVPKGRADAARGSARPL